MKTVFKRLLSQKAANKKRKSFEASTGVKWDWYSTGQGIIFTPIATRETLVNPKSAERVLQVLRDKDSTDFISLSRVTKLSLKDTLESAMYLVKSQQAIPVTNRCGNFAGIRKI